MKNSVKTLILSGLAAGLFSGAALAQDNIPGHPRVNEVDQRLEHQQDRIDNGIKDGQINKGEAYHDEKRDARIEGQEARDEAKHNGHLTKREQRHLNKELNKNSQDIHRQRHDDHGHRWHRRHEHE